MGRRARERERGRRIRGGWREEETGRVGGRENTERERMTRRQASRLGGREERRKGGGKDREGKREDDRGSKEGREGET